MQKKQYLQSFGFYLIYPFLWVIGWLPLWALYRLSDILFVLIVATGYRRNVITSNLNRAYPGQSRQFIRKIRIRFYRHFCDMIVETIALLHINPKEIQRRVEPVNLEIIRQSLEKGRDVVAVIGHYGNWEWMPVLNLGLSEKVIGCSVYRPLKNRYFDQLMIQLRSSFKTINFPLKNTVREIVKMKQSNQRFVLGLIADQSPSRYELQFWTSFLTQKTPIILGPEKMCKLADADLFFWRMEKIKRGRYRATIIPYPGNVKTDPEFKATRWHVKQLEEQIYQQPEIWLWSHKRWKYQHLYDGQTYEI